MKTLTTLFCLILISASVHAQILSVEGEVLTPLKLSMNDLMTMKSSIVHAKDKEGKEHTYKGVHLHEILNTAGVTLGAQLVEKIFRNIFSFRQLMDTK